MKDFLEELSTFWRAFLAIQSLAAEASPSPPVHLRSLMPQTLFINLSMHSKFFSHSKISGGPAPHVQIASSSYLQLKAVWEDEDEEGGWKSIRTGGKEERGRGG